MKAEKMLRAIAALLALMVGSALLLGVLFGIAYKVAKAIGGWE